MKAALAVIGTILLFPFRVLFFPVELLLRWRDGVGGFEPQLEHKPPNRRSISREAPTDLPHASEGWFQQAVSDALDRLSQSSRSDLLLALFPLVILGFLGFVFFEVYVHADDIESRYRQGAQAAMDANDIPLAKTYFSRIVSERELSDRDRLNWAMILSNTGEVIRGQQVLDDLAPDDRLRYVPAHRAKALALVNLLGEKQDAETLRKLRTQLEFATDNTPQINHAWAMYYLAVEQTDRALGYLGAAAKTDPQFLIMMANINERIGRRPARDRALRQAEKEYRRLLVQDPLDARNRVILARVLAQLERYGEAEQTLLTGMRLNNDLNVRQAAADYYVMRYDLAVREGTDFDEQFGLLQKALALDEAFLAVYERMIQLYQRQTDRAEAESIKKALLTTVAGNQPSAFAHFALSNMYWIEEDHEKAQWHVKQAYELDPKFVIVVNNLAWMLAHKENPDLERALKLAETALKTAPSDARILDTYGSILLLQKKYEQAITAMQKALPKSEPGVSKSIHEKLAVCYEAIGQTELAKVHSKQAAKVSPTMRQSKQR